MSGPKDQHYVPRTYLKQFSYDDAKDPHVYVLSKDDGRIFEAGIKKIAVENNFYTVDEGDDKYKWERHYSEKVEPVLGRLILDLRKRCETVLVQNKTVVLTQKEKEDLSKCVLAQMLRGKPAREFSQNIYEMLLPDMLDDLRKQLGPIDERLEQVIESYKHEDKRKLILMDATIKEKYASLNVLENMLFIFIKIVGARTFVTSDDPVMFINLCTRDATPFANGIADSSTGIFYSLSPKLLLFAVNKTPLMSLLDREDCSLEIINASKETRFIDTVNQKHLEHCFNCVYSQTEEELRKLQKVLS